MKGPVKPYFLLFCLVFGIYMMRNNDMSFGDAFNASVKRLLDSSRPSDSLCKTTDINEAFSASQLERAATFRDSIRKMRNGNPLLDLLTSGDLIGNLMPVYVTPTIQYIAPWPILFIVSIITFACIGCNWCCIYGCCKNTKCCKCCKAPQDSKRKRLYIVFSIIFLLGALGAAISGIIVGNQVATGMEVTVCSVISVVEDLQYGVPSQKWIGVNSTISSLDSLVNKFDDAVNTLSQSSSSISDINNKLTIVKNRLKTMETTVNGLTKPLRPDQTKAATYTPSYGANIGPPENNQSYTGMIQQECQIRYDILDKAQPTINDGITALKTAGIKTQIQDGVDIAKRISNSITDLLNNVVQYGGIAKDVIKAVGSAVTGVFIANLVVALGTIGSIFMVGCCKKNFFNKFLLSNSFMMIIFSIFGWLIVSIFYPLSLIMMETCDVLDQITVIDGTSEQKQQSQNILGKVVATVTNGNGSPDILNVCLFDNGDMMSQFGIADSLSGFDDIFTQFDSITNGKNGVGGMNIADAPPGSVMIEGQITLTTNMKSGLMPDADETVTDLTTLNKATNKNINSCTTVYDIWQLNSENCDSSMGYKFVTADAETKNQGSQTCIGLEAWSGSPPTHDINNRYTATQYPAGCSDVALTIPRVTTFVTDFKTNRNDVSSYFTSVQNELNNIKNNEYMTFAAAIQAVLKDFASVQTKLKDVKGLLTDSNSGLLKNLNCNFVGTDLKRVSNAMCIGFIATLYQTSVVIIISSVMAFLASIFVFCLGKRFILPPPGQQAKPV